MLLLTDPVDEVWVGMVPEFDGKPLQSVAKGEVDLSSEEDTSEAEREERQKEFADLLTWLQETLSDHVKEVRLSTRLTESPACLITDAFGMTPALARIYRASGQEVPVGKRILELNPSHPLVTACAKPTRTAQTMPRNHWPKPRNYFTAQRFSPKAAHSRIRRGSPSCWPNVSRVPCSELNDG